MKDEKVDGESEDRGVKRLRKMVRIKYDEV